MALLARREHSCAELKHKLYRAGLAGEDVVDALVEELRRQQYVSDSRFAETFIRARAQRGYGPRRIVRELTQRGVAKDLVDEQLDWRDAVWTRECERMLEKRFGGQKSAGTVDELKRKRFLYNRGFTEDQIRAALRSRQDL